MADFSGDPPPVIAPATHRPVGRVSSADMLQPTVPVRATSATLRTLLQVTLDVDPGDILAIDGRVVLTNDNSYTVGAGGHIWMWDATLPYTETWERVSPYTSDNVSLSRHHMPVMATADWRVPDTWTPGTPMTLAMMVSAFSDSPSRSNAHVVTAEDGYGLLRVERWAEDTVLADALARLTTIEEALTALQTASATQAAGISALAAADSVHVAALADHEGRLLNLEA